MELELLCEYWTRLAENREASSFTFGGFSAETVATKLLQMEHAINDPKVFRLPCNAPMGQRANVLAQCGLLASAEGRRSLANVDGNGELWEHSKGETTPATPETTDDPAVTPPPLESPEVVSMPPASMPSVSMSPSLQPAAIDSPSALSARAVAILTQYAGEEHVQSLRCVLQAVPTSQKVSATQRSSWIHWS